MLGHLRLGPVELGVHEGLGILRIGHGGEVPVHLGELLHPPVGHRLGQLGLGMGGEELPGRRSAPLLAHEDHRRERAEQRDERRQPQGPVVELAGQALPVGPVADLIMVVGADDQPPRRRAAVDPVAVAAAAEAGVRSGVEEALLEHLAQRGEGVEVGVVTGGVTGQADVEGVVEVVAPLGGQPVPARLPGRDQPRIVEVRLGDQRQRPAEERAQRAGLDGQLLQDVRRPGVDEGVHGVQPETVDVVVVHPHHRVVDDVAPDLVGVLPVEVGRCAPGVESAGVQVRGELGQVVAARAEVVVDDVLDHRQAAGVAGVDEALIRRRSSVLGVHREPQHPVVAPVVRTVERVHRHQLDEVDAEFGQVVEPADGGVQRALGGEGADVHLVDHAAGQLPTGPGVIGPREARRVVGPGQPVNAVRLPARPGIRPRLVVIVEQEAVVDLGRAAEIGHRAGRDATSHPRPWPSRPAIGPSPSRSPSCSSHPLELWRPDGEGGHTHSSHPHNIGSGTRRMPNRSSTPARISRARSSRSAAVAPPRLVRASACLVDRVAGGRP